jgi:hypothetical protein
MVRRCASSRNINAHRKNRVRLSSHDLAQPLAVNMGRMMRRIGNLRRRPLLRWQSSHETLNFQPGNNTTETKILRSVSEKEEDHAPLASYRHISLATATSCDFAALKLRSTAAVAYSNARPIGTDFTFDTRRYLKNFLQHQTPTCRVGVVPRTLVSVVLTRSSNGRVSRRNLRSEASVIANISLTYVHAYRAHFQQSRLINHHYSSMSPVVFF